MPSRACGTIAGNLPASAVIHTVGPVWHGGDRMEAQTRPMLTKQSAVGLGKQLSLHCVSGDKHRRVAIREKRRRSPCAPSPRFTRYNPLERVLFVCLTRKRRLYRRLLASYP